MSNWEEQSNNDISNRLKTSVGKGLSILKRKRNKKKSRRLKRGKLYKKVAIRIFRTAKVVFAACGGGALALVIVCVFFVALVICSGFGIFFANSTAGKYKLTDTINDFENSFYRSIKVIEDRVPHDEIRIRNGKIEWKEVLALYAVVAQVQNNALEIVTLDEQKINILSEVFNNMYSVSYDTCSVEGKNVLKINVACETLEAMISKYSLTKEQSYMVQQLLDSHNDHMWKVLLAGTCAFSNKRLVDLAIEQLGNSGGEKFWRWYGFNSRVEWCACFVSWCLYNCIDVSKDEIPKFAACESEGVEWFRSHGKWKEKDCIPNAGDIIFFDWNGNNSADHVGIVEKIEGDYVYTIEGNSGDECKERKYLIGCSQIRGYGYCT